MSVFDSASHWRRNLTSPSPSVQNKAIVFFNRGNSTTSITATLRYLSLSLSLSLVDYSCLHLHVP